MKKRTALLLMLLTPACFALSQTQKALIDYLDTHQKQQIKLIKNTVNINSGTYNTKGVKKVAKVYQKVLHELGFKTTWIQLPKTTHRAGHLFAYHPGSKGKKLLLIGHLDTVFEKHHPFNQFKQTGHIAKGPGVIDIKGGNAVILYALKALKAQGALKDRQIIVALIGDEESTALPHALSRRPLIKAAHKSDIALGFESARDLKQVVTARRGLAVWRLDVASLRGHSSMIFTKEFGEGAILGLTELLNQMKVMQKPFPYLSFNPGLISGGSDISQQSNPPSLHAKGKVNVIASHAKAVGEIRFLYQESLNDFVERTHKATLSTQAPLKATFSLVSDRLTPAMEPTAGNMALLKSLSQINQDLGFGPLTSRNPRSKGAADISYVASQKLPALDGLGGVGDYDHSDKEHIDLDKTLAATKRAALFIYQLTHPHQA